MPFNSSNNRSQGVSYTLSALTVPSLLELPSASSAARAFRSLSATASSHISVLRNVAGTAFALAFVLSPRGFRHPYLMYTSLFCFGTGLTNFITPTLFGSPATSSSAAAKRKAALAKARKDKQAARRMESSYEVLGDAHSDEGTASNSGDELPEEDINGEDVRGEVEAFVQNKIVQTAVSAVGFAMAVVGIWGDGVQATFIVGI